MRIQIAFFLAALCWREPATAGAWTLPPGRGLAILKSETDAEYGETLKPVEDQAMSLFIERGVSQRTAVELLTGVQVMTVNGMRRTAPGEQAVGVKRQITRWRNVIVSGYAGERVMFDLGRGGLSAPTSDWREEVRGLVGANFQFWGRSAYVDLQSTILYAKPDQIQFRHDATLGVSMSRAMALSLAYRRGEDNRGPIHAAWDTVEATTIRKFGPWRLEAGWRRTQTAPTPTFTSGPIFSIWRSF